MASYPSFGRGTAAFLAVVVCALVAVVCAPPVPSSDEHVPPPGQYSVSYHNGQNATTVPTVPRIRVSTTTEDEEYVYRKEQADLMARRQQYIDEEQTTSSWGGRSSFRLPHMDPWTIYLTGLCVIALILCAFFVARRIALNSQPDIMELIDNYRGQCSNPDRPCACDGFRPRRQPQARPERRRDDVQLRPALPPRNGQRGSAYNGGSRIVDHTGETTHVYTRIPVPLSTPPMARRH